MPCYNGWLWQTECKSCKVVNELNSFGSYFSGTRHCPTEKKTAKRITRTKAKTLNGYSKHPPTPRALHGRFAIWMFNYESSISKIMVPRTYQVVYMQCSYKAQLCRGHTVTKRHHKLNLLSYSKGNLAYLHNVLMHRWSRLPPTPQPQMLKSK